MSVAHRVTQLFPRSAALNALRSSRYRCEREEILLLWSVHERDVRLTLEEIRERLEGFDDNLVDGLVALMMVDGLLAYKVLPDVRIELYPSRRGVSRAKKILRDRMDAHRRVGVS